MARPAGRTLRCTACGHLWRHPAAGVADTLREAEPAPRDELPRFGPALDPPQRGEPAVATGPAPQRRRRWLEFTLPLVVAVIILAALAALYLQR